MEEVITEPTHILESSAGCIDLIFINQPNVVMDSGVHLSLYRKFHHQIIYSKLNLKIEHPPPYIHKIWDYNRSETNSVNRSIQIFDWSYLFSGKNVHEQVELFNKTLLNIFHNFILTKLSYVLIKILFGCMTKSKYDQEENLAISMTKKVWQP